MTDAGLRTPLLDCFRRGEVTREVRLLAAQGAIAPRPVEQLGLLMLLTTDSDSEIRDMATATLQRIPVELIGGFIARSDVPAELREFFVRRGVAVAATPLADVERPFVDDDNTEYGADIDTGDNDVKDQTTAKDGKVAAEKGSVLSRLATMSVPEKVRAAMKGTREMRHVLVRDPNKLVALAVLSCPKVNEAEVEGYARMGSVGEDVLRTIAQTRAWTKNYGVVLGLVKNAKTPLATSLTLLNRLIESDVRRLSTDRNVAEPLRRAARKKLSEPAK